MRFLITIMLATMCAQVLYSQSASKATVIDANKEWSCYGHDAGGTRFSPLKQINDKNVKSLTLAWTYRTGELNMYTGTNAASKAAFEATPLMIGGILYFSTPSCRVIAIDAATGKHKWMYDPNVNLRDDHSEITTRCVSSWPAANDTANATAKRRILFGTIDGRLIALDAENGHPILDFGSNGQIDLKSGFG